VADPEIQEAVRRLANEMAEFRRVVSDRLAADRAREKAFDALYEELKQYKEDFLFKAERPLLLDLLLFYDSLNWFQESLVKAEMSPDVLADSFQYLIDEFLEVLYRRDVVPSQQSDTLDLKVHKVVRVAETDDPAAHQRVAVVLKRGFQRGETLLRPEEVSILRHRGAKDA
jgi:molecular chaperone GrpE (heat shock protein)